MAKKEKKDEVADVKPVEESTVASTPSESAPVEQAGPKEDSPAKAEYRKIIEAYAKTNPVKYELKKATLLAKLNTL